MIRKDGKTPLFDGLGSERTVTSSSQAVTASLTLSAFGQTTASSGSSSNSYQFGATSGYRTEGDAGLTLVGCRFYDAQVGRFITRDTYLDQAPYAYCDGDPVNTVDPDGHDPAPLGLKPPTDPSQTYRDYWPTQIWVHVGPPKVKGGAKVKIGPGEINGGVETSGPRDYPIDGPKYWSHLHPGTRSTIKNLADLQMYVQAHEGVPTH